MWFWAIDGKSIQEGGNLLIWKYGIYFLKMGQISQRMDGSPPCCVAYNLHRLPSSPASRLTTHDTRLSILDSRFWTLFHCYYYPFRPFHSTSSISICLDNNVRQITSWLGEGSRWSTFFEEFFKIKIKRRDDWADLEHYSNTPRTLYTITHCRIAVLPRPFHITLCKFINFDYIFGTFGAEIFICSEMWRHPEVAQTARNSTLK